MLDQNTDRMWFVIGAVIVGAAIIFIANGTLPTLFASVSESFEQSAEKGTEIILEIKPGANINRIDMAITEANRGWYIGSDDGQDKNGSSSVNHYVTNYMPVDPGVTYTFETGVAFHNYRIAYYDSNKNFIPNSHKTILGHSTQVNTVAPSGARYARASAGRGVRYGVDTWWFGEAR